MAKIDYEKENMDQLAEKVRQGCGRTRDEMIEGYIPLVKSKVTKWLNLYPSLENARDDMLSEGYLAVVKAVNSIATTHIDNVTAYVSVAIVHHIGDFLDKNYIIRVPWSSDEDPPNVEPIFEPSVKIAEPGAVLEIMDMIEAACLTDEDRAIVDLLSRGYTEREISAQLDIPQSTVNILRYEIHERYCRLERC